MADTSGTYQEYAGASTCVNCTVGFYSGATSSSVCEPCAKGKEAMATTQPILTAPSPSRSPLLPTLTLTLALALALGKYAPSEGTASCDSCPTPTSSEAGSDGCQICIPSYFSDPTFKGSALTDPTSACLTCPENANCDGRSLPGK